VTAPTPSAAPTRVHYGGRRFRPAAGWPDTGAGPDTGTSGGPEHWRRLDGSSGVSHIEEIAE